jgi:hypothetical protein
MADDQDDQVQQEIFQIVVAECRGFYKLVITVATAFLGGTVLLFDRLAPEPASLWSLAVLGAGWLSLVGSIVAVSYVRRWNIESGRLTLKRQEADAELVATKARKATDWTVLALALGMVLVSFFRLVNFAESGGTKETAQHDQGQ